MSATQIDDTAVYIMKRSSTHSYLDAVRDFVYSITFDCGEIWEHHARLGVLTDFVEEHILPRFGNLHAQNVGTAYALADAMVKYAAAHPRSN